MVSRFVVIEGGDGVEDDDEDDPADAGAFFRSDFGQRWWRLFPFVRRVEWKCGVIASGS